MKRRICLLLACLLLMTCAAAAADTPVPTAGITIPEVTVKGSFTIPDNEAMRFVRDMKVGWNLGNTFDANDYLSWFKGPESRMETAWVNAMTTPELIQALYDAGFRTMRLPVSWHDHVDAEYNISPVWLNRVREVAGYALDLGMYVIVNVHHDNSTKYFYPDTEHYEQSAKYLTRIWQQMAEVFADCGDHLILESMNEPRLVGTNYEWNWTNVSAQCKDAAACINRLNQLFVNTVRAAGGNNATRYLMVPAYDANPYYTVDQSFLLPKDTQDNRIIVSAHAYTPYNFALNLNSSKKDFDAFKAADTRDIDDFMDKLYKRYVSKGIPVVLDEFGALDKGGNLQDRVNFAAYYVAAASARGMTACWWDNHAFSGNGELFGLIDRNKITWTYPDIVLAIQQYCMTGRE